MDVNEINILADLEQVRAAIKNKESELDKLRGAEMAYEGVLNFLRLPAPAAEPGPTVEEVAAKVAAGQAEAERKAYDPVQQAEALYGGAAGGGKPSAMGRIDGPHEVEASEDERREPMSHCKGRSPLRLTAIKSRVKVPSRRKKRKQAA